MQISFSIFILLTSIWFIGVIASPVNINKRDKRMIGNPQPPEIIVRPGMPVFHICGLIGDFCKDNSQCCSNNACDNLPGYNDDLTRCCGGTGATGCNITAPGSYSGCCAHSHHCAVHDPAKGTTWCVETLYKRKRAIQP